MIAAGLTLARHDLAWLRDPSRAAVWVAAPALWPEVERWSRTGRPFVVRRRQVDDPPDGVPLGLPLPPAKGRVRIALVVDSRAVVRTGAPPSLDDVVDAAPGRWRPALRQVAAEARDVGAVLRVYGSLAWQHLTGEAYVTDESDADLLALARDHEELRRLCALLSRREADRHPRLDGEIVLPDGGAVAWRELVGGQRAVLVKRLGGAAIEASAELLARLEGAAATHPATRVNSR